MGKVEYFTILLNKPTEVYMPGEALKGVLNFRVKERFKINSVNMKIVGEARVHWTEQHGSGNNRHTVHYHGYEKYMDMEIYFIKKAGNQDLYLEAMDYSYPFEIILPQNLPTSFEHSTGQVRYSLNGTVDIPWAFDKHTKRSFSVISHYDLNNNQSLRQTYGVSDQKVVCCGPCKSDPIIANFSLMKTGFVPGEAIVFNCSIENNSSREIKEMTVNLLQVIRFHATRKTRTLTRNVAQIRYPSKIPARQNQKWDTSVLVIPPVCSTSNGTCRIIDVSYRAVFNFDASGGAISKDMIIPIVIGTIPLAVRQSIPPQNYPFTFEGDMFGPNPSKIPIEGETEERGDVIESNANSFRPIYPYFKDFSINNQ